MQDSGFYIDFLLSDQTAWKRMQKLFGQIAELKAIAYGGQIADLEYLILEQKDLFFSEREWERFWWPTQAELQQFWNTYQKLSDQARQQHFTSVPWDFESVFDAIGQGEYLIQDCVRLKQPGQYRLSYLPLAHPFGGTEALEAVLRIYGAVILFNSWLTENS